MCARQPYHKRINGEVTSRYQQDKVLECLNASKTPLTIADLVVGTQFGLNTVTNALRDLQKRQLIVKANPSRCCKEVAFYIVKPPDGDTSSIFSRKELILAANKIAQYLTELDGVNKDFIEICDNTGLTRSKAIVALEMLINNDVVDYKNAVESVTGESYRLYFWTGVPCELK